MATRLLTQQAVADQQYRQERMRRYLSASAMLAERAEEAAAKALEQLPDLRLFDEEAAKQEAIAREPKRTNENPIPPPVIGG